MIQPTSELRREHAVPSFGWLLGLWSDSPRDKSDDGRLGQIGIEDAGLVKPFGSLRGIAGAAHAQ